MALDDEIAISWALSLQKIMKFDHILLGKFWEADSFPIIPKGEMEIAVSIKFSLQTCPFPINFYPRTTGKFWFFYCVLFSLLHKNNAIQ